jgi:peptidoglycan-associated lipoprotein
MTMLSRSSRILCSATICAATICGCGSKALKKLPIPPPAEPAPAAQATAVPPNAQPVAASPNVGVDDELARKCSLHFANPHQAPKFGYDAADLLPSDRDILQQVADCLTRGPLQGRSVKLVGRTDPRGTDEYNLALGTRRAENVRTYLERLGVPARSLSPTTRGEVDASGSDEAGWQRDRRVDLQLVN